MSKPNNKHKIAPSEITSKEVYLKRRTLLAGLAAASLIPNVQAALPPAKPWDKSLSLETTPKDRAFSYNNFYELGPAKDSPSESSDLFKARPWEIEITGEVANPGVFGVEDLLALAPLQERIYRLRCVEAWSMVVPWLGFPLKALIDKVAPTGNAKYIAFETFNPEVLFPDDANNSLPWPYVEGLRMDEAAHDLTLLTFGMYGDELLNQNGAPVRIVVPWKYGYKSIKSIVKISFTQEQPPTSWNRSQPREYGFYSNVNPTVNHPRWSQARERAISADFFPKKQDTLMFNGYDEVASLYAGMDLEVNH